MGHFVKQCVHGVVVSTCRCASRDKEVRVVACPAKCDGRYVPKHSTQVRRLGPGIKEPRE